MKRLSRALNTFTAVLASVALLAVTQQVQLASPNSHVASIGVADPMTTEYSTVKDAGTQGQELDRPSRGKERKSIRAVAKAIRSGEVTVHLGDNQLDFNGARAALTDDGGIIATVPITGSVVEPSNVSVITNARGTIRRVIETQYLPLDRVDSLPSAGRVTMWVDGRLTTDRMVDDAGNEWDPAADPITRSGADTVELVWSFSKFKKCLNRQGVSAWVVAAISVACSAICVGTAGTACAICIAAAGSVTATTITYCIRTS